jgi:recombination protein RecA
MRLGKGQQPVEIETISTGSLGLDIALGVGGLPRGRIIEIYGPEASGKTTVSLHAIANAQKAGGVAAFIDAEHALDPGWAKRIGVDLEALLVSQPQHGEEALKIAEMLVRSNAVDIIVIDSVAALVPKAEIDGEIGDSKVGVHARLMSQALRVLTPSVSKSKTCLIFINQIRQKIGVMYGNPETTSGGLALKFFASVRLDIRKVTSIKEGDEVTGAHVRVKVVKNKIAPPFKQVEFDLLHERGISWESDLLSIASECGVIKKTGGYYTVNGTTIQGEAKTQAYLRDHPELEPDLRRQVIEKMGLADVVNAPATTESEPEPSRPAKAEGAPAKRGRGKAAAAPKAPEPEPEAAGGDEDMAVEE